MTMTAGGVAKLIEECGELQQILGKRLAYWYTDEHPDGMGSINERVEAEMGDVRAAIQFVMDQLDLDVIAINERAAKKFRLFKTWDAEPNNNAFAIDRHTR